MSSPVDGDGRSTGRRWSGRGSSAIRRAVFIDSLVGLILERDGVARLPHQPVTDVVADPDGLGYYPAADGGVFDVTDQPFHGSASRLADTPIVAITPTV